MLLAIVFHIVLGYCFLLLLFLTAFSYRILLPPFLSSSPIAARHICRWRLMR